MRTPGLPITLDLDGKRVVVVGPAGDDEGRRKLELLRESGAEVEEWDGFDALAIASLAGAALVLSLRRDPELAAAVQAAAHARGVLCWCADDPAHSDFTMPAIARLGPARIAVSTAGGSPMLAARLRQAFERALGERFARFVEALGDERERLRDDPRPLKQSVGAALDGFELEVTARYPGWFEPQG